MSYVHNLRKCVGTQPLILPGASVIIVSDEKILFQYRLDTGNWGLPGGLMEPGESLEDCARREVHEETGLILGRLELLGVFSGPEYYYRYPHGDEIYNVTAAYVSRDILRGDMVKQADEVLELRFFDLNELPTNILQPEQPIVDQYILHHNKELD